MQRSKLKLIKAEAENIVEIAEIARKTWYVVYPDIITTEQIEFMLKKFYDAEVLSKTVGSSEHLFLLIQLLEEGKNIGFLHFSQTSEAAWHLQKFYILPEYHKQNFGSQAFETALDELRNFAPIVPKEIRLNVNRINFKAINFYFKNGFTIEELKDIDIGDGFFMNDFIMLRRC
jgi:ribosomal protein S18 acetylase RimI-like enzyme